MNLPIYQPDHSRIILDWQCRWTEECTWEHSPLMPLVLRWTQDVHSWQGGFFSTVKYFPHPLTCLDNRLYIHKSIITFRQTPYTYNTSLHITSLTSSLLDMCIQPAKALGLICVVTNRWRLFHWNLTIRFQATLHNNCKYNNVTLFYTNTL